MILPRLISGRYTLLRCFLTMTLFLPALLMGQQAVRPESRWGWDLSVQTYSFRSYTVLESIERAQEAGLDALEIFPEQKIGGKYPGYFNHEMDASTRLAMKILLQKEGMRMLSFGVLGTNEAEEWEAIFAFVKEMGGEYLIMEPAQKDLPLIGRLASQYQVKAAIHNHPQPSFYWSPEVVLESIAMADSPYVGACADIGHWLRSGLDPLACLRQLQGHVFSLHFKDLYQSADGARDQVWGTGQIDMEGVVTELIRQGFRGNIVAEYEDNPQANVEHIRQSIVYFRDMLRRRP